MWIDLNSRIAARIRCGIWCKLTWCSRRFSQYWHVVLSWLPVCTWCCVVFYMSYIFTEHQPQRWHIRYQNSTQYSTRLEVSQIWKWTSEKRSVTVCETHTHAAVCVVCCDEVRVAEDCWTYVGRSLHVPSVTSRWCSSLQVCVSRNIVLLLIKRVIRR